MTRPRIALSMGDPAGIGPELCARAAADAALAKHCSLVVYGSSAIFARIHSRLGLLPPENLIDCDAAGLGATIEPGQHSQAAGALSIAALSRATADCLAQDCQGLVTAPINKASVHLAGFPHPGHTEFLAAACNSERVAMALTGSTMTVVLATIHCSLLQAVASLSVARIVNVGSLLHQALSQRLGRSPRLACLGLNPHAGEGGLFGDEEQRIISPAIESMRSDGINVVGPLPADTAFAPGVRSGFDGYICCYHDQGLIPFKTLHFHDGVNWTLGLPIIRTSPDHGTAFDRAWQGSADGQSMHQAILLAASLALGQDAS